MENKTKKRLGIVAIMLVLLLAIGATAGTTLARYISSAKVESQTATVAKWGYTLTADTSKMFGEKYGDAAEQLAKVVSDNAVVASARSKNVVAPGTEGSMTIQILGSSEVNAQLELDLTDAFSTIYLKKGATADGDKDNGTVNTGAITYYPIKWAVAIGATATSFESKDITSAKDLGDLVVKAVENKFTAKNEAGKVTIQIPANSVNLKTNNQITIAWKWDLGSTNVNDKDNINDTILGYLADRDAGGKLEGWATYFGAPSKTVAEFLKDYAKTNDYLLDIALNIKATIMQVQAFAA